MNVALTSFTSVDCCNNQHISSIISSGSGNAIKPAAHYIYGAGNYMTLHPGLYYPNACLFCGFPNGVKKEIISTPTGTNQEAIVATAAPTMQFYSAETNENSYNHLLEITTHKHTTCRNLASIMSKLISKRVQTIFQKWRHFLVVTQGRKRGLLPSLF